MAEKWFRSVTPKHPTVVDNLSLQTRLPSRPATSSRGTTQDAATVCTTPHSSDPTGRPNHQVKHCSSCATLFSLNSVPSCRSRLRGHRYWKNQVPSGSNRLRQIVHVDSDHENQVRNLSGHAVSCLLDFIVEPPPRFVRQHDGHLHFFVATQELLGQPAP